MFNVDSKSRIDSTNNSSSSNNYHNNWEINSVESITESTDSAFHEYNEMTMAFNKKSLSEYQFNLNIIDNYSLRDRKCSSKSSNNNNSQHYIKNKLENQLMYIL